MAVTTCFRLEAEGMKRTLEMTGWGPTGSGGGMGCDGASCGSRRGKRANAWFPPWTWEPEIQNKTLLTSI